MAKIPLPYAPDPLVKQPTEVWAFVMPFGRLLGGKTIDEVSEVRVWLGTYPDEPKTTAIPDPASPPTNKLKLDDDDHDADQVSLTLSQGEDGDDYYIEIDVETTDGSIRSADGWLLVRDQREE